MEYTETEHEAFKIIKKLIGRDQLRDIKEHGEMRGRVYSTGAVQRHVWYLIQRHNYLNNEERYEVTRNLSTGECVGETNIDRAMKVSSILNSMGSEREKVFERRDVCLEEGVTEQELKTIEDYMGIHNLSDQMIRTGSIGAMEDTEEFIEQEIKKYWRELFELQREETRRIFENKRNLS